MSEFVSVNPGDLFKVSVSFHHFINDPIPRSLCYPLDVNIISSLSGHTLKSGSITFLQVDPLTASSSAFLITQKKRFNK